MTEIVKCPKCGSEDVMFSKKKQLYICEDCRNEFTVEHKRSSRRIYLSHGIDEHSDLAMRIKRDLEARGHEVFYGSGGVLEGAERDKFVEAGLDWVSEVPGEGRFLVILTPASVRRPDGYCLDEIAKAVQRKLAIIPVMASFCEPPLNICRIQWLNMMGCYPLEEKEDEYLKQLDALVGTIEGETSDYKGAQSRLLRVLEPLPFDADIQRHLARFTGRQWIFRRVDAWLADAAGSRIFWIVGPPGVGKTAIASWIASHRPEVAAFHLCSFGDAQKSDPRRTILSIAYQLSTQLPDYQDRLKAVNLEKIARESNAKTLFDQLLIQPLSGNPGPGHVVAILIDALDEATQGGKNELSDLIAAEFDRLPGWLRLILTSRPEPEVMHPLQGLTPYVLDTSSPENAQDIRDFLAQELRPYAEGIEVPGATIDRIAAMSEGIFLYVEWIRQELAQKRLSLGRLDEFPRGLAGVYSQFFTRQYPEVTRYRSRISPALETIVSALEPLAVGMIAAIFRWDEYDQAEFVQELGGLFPVTEGKVRPFHRSVIDWLTDAGKAADYYIDAINGHLKLADHGWQEYRSGVPLMSPYMSGHLPAHLIQVERWDDVVSMLTDMAYFEVAWKQSEFVVESYWSQIEGRSGRTIVDAYRPVFAAPRGYDRRTAGVASLLYVTGHYPEALSLYDNLIPSFAEKAELQGLKDAYEKKGLILTYRGQNADAMRILKEQESICRKTNDTFGLVSCLLSQIIVLLNLGEMKDINRIAEEMEKHADSMNRRQITLIMHARAVVCSETGNIDEALRIYRDKEKICRELKDPNCLYGTLNNMAVHLYDKGEFDECLKVLQEFEKLCLDHGNKYALMFCLLLYGDLYYDSGRKTEAIEMLKRSEEIAIELGHKKTIFDCLDNMAIILHDTGALDEAMKLQEEALKVCREQNDKLGTGLALGNIALIRYDRGQLGEAMELLREKERLARESSVARGVAAALGNQALILFDRDQIGEAVRLHREEEQICRDLSRKRDLDVCLYNQANIRLAGGRTDEAMKLYVDLEREFRRLNDHIGVQGCLNGRALVLRSQGRPEEALALLEEAAEICRRVEYKKGLLASLGNRAAILYDRGEAPGSSRLLTEAEAICRGIDFQEGLAIALIDRAIVAAYYYNDRRQARELAEEAGAIVARCGFLALGKQMLPVRAAIEELAPLPPVAADGGGKNLIAARAPQLISWIVKKQKHDKNI